MEKENVVVGELFKLLDSVQDQIGIVDWGIKISTLEDGKQCSPSITCLLTFSFKNNANTRVQLELSYFPSINIAIDLNLQCNTNIFYFDKIDIYLDVYIC